MSMNEFLNLEGLGYLISKIKSSQVDTEALKQWVLKNSTKDLYGLGEDGSPDDIFQVLYETSFKGHCFVKVIVKKPNGELLKNARVNITKPSGNISNTILEDGTGIFLCSLNETITASIPSNIVDISGSASIITPSNGFFELPLTISYVNFKLFNSTTTIQFSDSVSKIEYSLCGGGGGGSTAVNVLYDSTTMKYDTISAGAGGGGGYNKTGVVENIDSYINYQITVGSGGGSSNSITNSPSSESYFDGKSGGASSCFGVTANGGNGGVACRRTPTTSNRSNGGLGNGNGGSGGWQANEYPYTAYPAYSGNAGSGIIYISFTEETTCGGGGGGGGMGVRNAHGSAGSSNFGAGGNPNGGLGGYISWVDEAYEQDNTKYTGHPPTAGKSYGGGGGGGANRNLGFSGSSSTTIGSSGGKGVVSIRIYHKD